MKPFQIRREWIAPLGLTSAAIFIVVASVAFSSNRLTWFFTEWAKLRTPNPSFARNTLFWEQRDFPEAGSRKIRPHLHAVGSSQINAVVDVDQLAQETGRYVEKNALAGFGPIQYGYHWPRIVERKPDVIICWLSEFDFYREDAVPANRLRWAGDLRATATLMSQLSPLEAFENRGALADLAASSACPLWRHREHVHRTVCGYWWNVSKPRPGDDANALAPMAAFDKAIDYPEVEHSSREAGGRQLCDVRSLLGERGCCRC